MTAEQELEDYLADAPDFSQSPYTPTPWTSYAPTGMADAVNLIPDNMAQNPQASRDYAFTPFESRWTPQPDGSLEGKGNYSEYLQQFKDAGMVSPVSFTQAIDAEGARLGEIAKEKEFRTNLESGQMPTHNSTRFQNIGGRGFLVDTASGTAKQITPDAPTKPKFTTIKGGQVIRINPDGKVDELWKPEADDITPKVKSALSSVETALRTTAARKAELTGKLPKAENRVTIEADLAGLDAKEKALIGQAQQMTNAPVKFEPPTQKTKAQLANDLAKQHPDWTRQQIIDAVNGKGK